MKDFTEMPDFDDLFQMGSSSLEQMPFEIWLEIISYMDLQPNTLAQLSRVNKMFGQICQINHVWNHCYECTFPVLYKEMLEKP